MNRDPLPYLFNSAGSSTYPTRKSVRTTRATATTAAVLAEYIKIVELAEPTEVPRITHDPDDDHVLACALAAKAELIVSGDKRHLLVLTEYQDIPIRNASDALSELTASSPPQK